MQINSCNPNVSAQSRYSSCISFKRLIVDEKSIIKHLPEGRDIVNVLNISNSKLNKLFKKYLGTISGQEGRLCIKTFGDKGKFNKDIYGMQEITDNFTEKNILNSSKKAIIEYNWLSSNQPNNFLGMLRSLFNPKK